MPASLPARNKRGTIGLEEYKGYYRLRLPRDLFDGKQRYLNTGVVVSTETRRSALALLKRLELDILEDKFDYSLSKYRDRKYLSVVVPNPEPKAPTLREIFSQYAAWRRPQIAETTYNIGLGSRYPNIIKCLPTTRLDEAPKIRDWLLKNRSTSTAKQALVQFNAACEWAVRSQILEDNPFKGITIGIRVTHQNEADPFTREEIATILEAFENNVHHRYYLPYVRFLFLTGCRTGEAVGLRWGSVANDFSSVTFKESISRGIHKPSTKTSKPRRFPCGDSLRRLLREHKPGNAIATDLVFPNVEGSAINTATFLHNTWKGHKNSQGIVTKLAEDGLIERYRKLYSTRATFITLALESGTSVAQVSRWVGCSSEVIHRHYYGVVEKYQPPEI